MILKYDDILKISTFFKENGYEGFDIELVNYLPNDKLLNRVNDDFFYRINRGEGEKPEDNTDEVSVKVGEYKFTYKVRNEDS